MTPRPFPTSHHEEVETAPPTTVAAQPPDGVNGEDEPPEPPEQRRQDVVLTELWCQMLIDLYELPEALPSRLPGQPIPSRIWSSLRKGKVPSQTSLAKLRPEWRAELRLQTGCACGFRHLQRIGYGDVCDLAERLQEQGEEGPYLGSCLVLLLALVLGLPPSEEMVHQLTNHYSNTEADLERTEQFLFELILALLARHTQEVLRALSAQGDDDDGPPDEADGSAVRGGQRIS